MKKGIVVAISLIWGTVLLAACAPAVAPAPAPAPAAPAPVARAPASAAAPSIGATAAPAKPAWQVEWDETQTAALREGKVVVYNTASIMKSPFPAFKQRYGISVETVNAVGGELVERLKRERRAQIYDVDVYISTGGAKMEVKAAGILAPFESFLILPEVLDSRAWFDSKLPWVDKDRTILALSLSPTTTYVVNTELVKLEEVRSYRDLLSPKWKGKMTMHDPSIVGAGNTWFSGVGEYIMGYDYMRQLARQELIILRDYRQQTEWVARAKYPIAIAPSFGTIGEFQKIGTPISWVIPLEGNTLTAGGSTLSFIERAPHPNAAKLFINWLLTKEGLTAWTKPVNAQTTRVDVPTDFLDAAMVRQPGVKYVSLENEEFYLKRLENLKLAQEIFGMR